MADLSEKEGENYEKGKHAKLYKNVTTVMQKGISPSAVADFYSKWATNDEYETDNMLDGVYSGPVKMALAAADGLTDAQKGDVRVLDVAAGTGLSGIQLKKLGFQHIDALDPAQGMLDRARQKGIYENYTCAFISDVQLDIPKDTYDVLTVSGGFGEGHIPCSALHEMIRVVKPGGVIVIVTRAELINIVAEYKNRLEPLMDQLETEGKWKQLKREIFKGYFMDKDGILYKYQVM